MIDWFTVAAQIINFLILVWLLKRFLYQPILAAMETREKRINDQLKMAEEKKVIAENEIEKLKMKNKEFDNEYERKIKQVESELSEKREEMIDDARGEIDQLKKQWKKALKESQEAIQDDLISKVQKEIFSISKKILRDIADTELEEKTIDQFLLKLRTIKFRELFEEVKPKTPVRVQTAMQLSEEESRKIKQTFSDQLPEEVDYEFEVQPELICGVRLLINHKKIGWTAIDYLDSLKEEIENRLGKAVSHESE